MIIIRYKNAKPLSSIFSPKDNKLKFANLILFSSEINIIYFEKEIQNKTFSSKELGKTYQLIGELERKNLPFILLIDKKCDIFEGGDLTIINADCLDYNTLSSHFGESTEKKSTLFNFIFQEYLEFNQGQLFVQNFYNFIKDAEQDGLTTKNLLFVAVSSKDGEIRHSMDNGDFFDGDKIWCFDETHSANLSINMLEEFSSLFESGKILYPENLKRYNEKELSEIIDQYPKLFVDFVKNKYSQYDEKEFETDTDEYYLAEYYEDAQDAAAVGMRVCYSCGEYFQEVGETVSLEGKMVVLCSPCHDSCYN